MMWSISKEQEQEFKHAILEKYPSNIIEGIDIDELFKLIRGAEYRRGKEDGLNDMIEIVNENFNQYGKLPKSNWINIISAFKSPKENLKKKEVK